MPQNFRLFQVSYTKVAEVPGLVAPGDNKNLPTHLQSRQGKSHQSSMTETENGVYPQCSLTIGNIMLLRLRSTRFSDKAKHS